MSFISRSLYSDVRQLVVSFSALNRSILSSIIGTSVGYIELRVCRRGVIFAVSLFCIYPERIGRIILTEVAALNVAELIAAIVYISYRESLFVCL